MLSTTRVSHQGRGCWPGLDRTAKQQQAAATGRTTKGRGALEWLPTPLVDLRLPDCQQWTPASLRDGAASSLLQSLAERQNASRLHVREAVPAASRQDLASSSPARPLDPSKRATSCTRADMEARPAASHLRGSNHFLPSLCDFQAGIPSSPTTGASAM